MYVLFTISPNFKPQWLLNHYHLKHLSKLSHLFRKASRSPSTSRLGHPHNRTHTSLQWEHTHSTYIYMWKSCEQHVITIWLIKTHSSELCGQKQSMQPLPIVYLHLASSYNKQKANSTFKFQFLDLKPFISQIFCSFPLFFATYGLT